MPSGDDNKKNIYFLFVTPVIVVHLVIKIWKKSVFILRIEKLKMKNTFYSPYFANIILLITFCDADISVVRVILSALNIFSPLI